jgi:hypothetical protein
VNRPGDRYEREADRLADRALRSPSWGDAPVAVTPMSQGGVQGSGGRAPQEVAGGLSTGGQPLSAATRELMENRMGHDFSQVRVHASGRAAAAADAIDARAYTLGQDVVFGRDQYRPEDPSGRRLLAHELVHTLQQRGTGVTRVIQRAGPSEEGMSAPVAASSKSHSFKVDTYGCHDDPFVRETVMTAARKAFDVVKDTDCIGSESLREEILDEFDGLSIDCEQDADGPCGMASRYLTQTVNIYPKSLKPGKCGPLASTILHEVVHLTEWGLFHGDLTDACEKACFGYGKGDASKCK